MIARDLARRTLVVARGGLVHTLRFASPRPVRSIRLGTDLLVSATPLADGTDRVLGSRTLGHARRAVVRATVVEDSRGHLVLSAGGSVFSVKSPTPRVARGARVAHGVAAPGEVIRATLQVGPTTVQPTSVQPVGQASFIDLQGVLSSVGPTSIVVAVSAGAITTVQIPASLALPAAVAVGDQVEVVTAYSAGTFSLVTIVDDTLAPAPVSAPSSQPSTSTSSSAPAVSTSVDGGARSVEIEGVVVSASSSGTATVGTSTGTATTLSGTATSPPPVSGGQLVIQPNDHASSVALVVPPTFSLPTLSAGTRVHAVAVMSGSVLTLMRLTVQAPEGGAPSCTPTQGGSGRGGNVVSADHGGGCGSSSGGN